MSAEFELTEDHVKLLRWANVGYFGESPNVQGYVGLHRTLPFGHDTDLVGNMAIILGFPVARDGEKLRWPKGTDSKMMKLFKEELPIALAVVLSAQSFKPGHYVKDDYNNWVPA